MKFSQYNEDSILESFFKGRKGFLVDIGAADGILNSNSRKLILEGWSAVLVEPNNKNFIKSLSLYENNPEVSVFNLGCSNNSDDDVIFYIDKNNQYEQLSTFSKEQMEWCKNYFKCDFVEEKVKVVKTSEFFESLKIQNIDFLSVDTESYDFNVIDGIDFEKTNIELICVEHVNEELINLLEKNGYVIECQDVGNTFFKKI